MNKTAKRVLTFTLIGLVVLFLIGNKAGWFKKGDEGPKAAGPAGPQALQVSGYIIHPGDLTDRIVATGTILAEEQIDVSPEVPGRITSIRFREGAYVGRGALLATINASELQAQLRKNQYTIQLAQEREQRQKALLTREAISQESYDQSLTQLNTARAEAALIQAQIAKTRIVAPFSGVIGFKHVSEGAYVTPGTRLTTLTRTQPVKIEFSVPERYASSVATGKTVNFQVEGSPESYSSTVYAIEPRIDLETRSLTVRARYPNAGNQLKPGGFVRLEFQLNQMDSALTVPAEALIPELGGSKVFISKGGKAHAVNVQTGIRTSDRIQITEGILRGDTVITSGLLQIKEGMPVKITIQ